MRSLFVMTFCPLHRPVTLFLDNPSQWGDVELLVLHTIKSAKVRAERAKYYSPEPSSRAYLMVGRTALMSAVDDDVSSAAQACQGSSDSKGDRQALSLRAYSMVGRTASVRAVFVMSRGSCA